MIHTDLAQHMNRLYERLLLLQLSKSICMHAGNLIWPFSLFELLQILSGSRLVKFTGLRFIVCSTQSFCCVQMLRSFGFSEHLVKALDETVNVGFSDSNGCSCGEIVTRIIVTVGSKSTELMACYGLHSTFGNHPSTETIRISSKKYLAMSHSAFQVP